MNYPEMFGENFVVMLIWAGAFSTVLVLLCIYWFRGYYLDYTRDKEVRKILADSQINYNSYSEKVRSQAYQSSYPPPKKPKPPPPLTRSFRE